MRQRFEASNAAQQKAQLGIAAGAEFLELYLYGWLSYCEIKLFQTFESPEGIYGVISFKTRHK